jgi:hypothetical protein
MENTTLRHCKKPKGTMAMLTAYPTVYDSLSLWYRSNRVSENPLKNGDRAVRQIVAHGFRGCVSQVRILPGPLSGVGRTMLANLSFLGGKLPLVTCCR